MNGPLELRIHATLVRPTVAVRLLHANLGPRPYHRTTLATPRRTAKLPLRTAPMAVARKAT